jgi:hypothetical protein
VRTHICILNLFQTGDPCQHASLLGELLAGASVKIVKSYKLHPSADMASSTTRSSDDLGSFARLPYDARVLIYEFALSRVDALDIIIFPSATSPRADATAIPMASVLNRAHLAPAILRLNKEINDEAMPFLYARNTFAFSGLEECQAFTNPKIPGRSLISHISLPRMAMSRPAYGWDSLHTFLPPTSRRLTIEIDTYSVPLPKVCHSLCRGLELYLKQVDSEPAARRNHFRDVVILRMPQSNIPRGFDYLDLNAEMCSSRWTRSETLLWQLLRESRDISHAAFEECFRNVIEDGLVGVGVFRSTFRKD